MKLRAALFLAAAVLGCTPAAASAGVRAGAARADITPPIGTPMFAYTARSAVAGGHVDRPMQIVADPDQRLYAKSFVPSRGVHVRLQARAIVLERDGLKYALVQSDLGGVPYALTQEVAERIAPTGIAAERILLSATHTHSGTGPIWPADNGGYGLLGGDLFDPRVFEATAAGIAEAIVKADERLQDARVGVGRTAVTNASRNRNFVPFKRNEDVPQNDEAAARAVSIDPTLTVLRVDDAAGRPMAVWSNFALHTTSFGEENLMFSGDNAAYTERIVERELGAQGAGNDVVNVWTNGAEGDISPDGGPTSLGGEPAEHVTSPFGSAHMAGKKVAAGVLEAWRDAGSRMTADPDIDARRSFVAFDGTAAGGRPVGPAAALGQGGIVADDGTCAPVEDMAGPGQGKKLPALLGAGLVPNVAPISMWEIDGLGIAAFPVEITKQMGERIRIALDREGYDRGVALAGLTNAYLSYTATPEEYDACHYEGSFTLFGRHMGLRWIDTILDLSRPLLADEEAPAGAPEPPSLGFGAPDPIPPRQTPAAGTVVAQPAATVARLAQNTFSWNGGDPASEIRPGTAFVTVERQTAAGWQTAFTDDSFQDATERTGRDVWTETVQFTECEPTGTYRVVVDGMADKGSGLAPYRVESQPFALTPAKLEAGTPTVSGSTIRFRGLYPNPGPQSLLATPRIVRDGTATLRLVLKGGKTETVAARPDGNGSFVATYTKKPVVSATVVSLTDGCGNRTA